MSGEMRKRLRKKMVEAVLSCNDKRRLRYMADRKLLLREVWCLCMCISVCGGYTTRAGRGAISSVCILLRPVAQSSRSTHSQPN